MLKREEGMGKDGGLFADGCGSGSGRKKNIRPWRASEAVWIASMDVLLGGVAYLL